MASRFFVARFLSDLCVSTTCLQHPWPVGFFVARLFEEHEILQTFPNKDLNINPIRTQNDQLQIKQRDHLR